MFVKHPKDDTLINLSLYFDIRCCPKNPTHIDFYASPQTENERGSPDYTVALETKEERNTWFHKLSEACSRI